MKKGQVSVEFMVIAGVLASILLFSMFIFNEQNSTFGFTKKTAEAKVIANKVARMVNEIYVAREGADKNILLGKEFDYNISFAGNVVRVNWEDNFVDAPLVTSAVDQNVFVAGEEFPIINSNGRIVFYYDAVVSNECPTQAACFSQAWNSAIFTCLSTGSPSGRYCTLAETAPFWTINNISNGTTITVTRIKVSWAGDTDGDTDVDVITINNVQRNSVASVSGEWNDVTDFTILPEESFTSNNWIRWEGGSPSANMDNETETYTITFEFSDASTYTTTGYNPA